MRRFFYTTHRIVYMSRNLVIVESPGKVKTIQNVLGADYQVLSCQGHIRDIAPLGKNSMGIDFNNHYKPNYEIESNKQFIVSQLQDATRKADTIWLASDEDREGEAIAWHLHEVLGLDKKDTKRIAFHEITKTAILDAIQHPRDIDYNMVNAQQARRLLDRIVGYELSPILWKKVTTGLSAGRVQSVVVRLVVEKEREIAAFKPTSHYRVLADFVGINPGDASIIRCELNHRFAHKSDALAFLESMKTARFEVSDIQRKPTKHLPAPPFTTSTLQQEAARKLKFSLSKTMRIAQSLYENGYITYMRTDSINLSALALSTCRQVITEQYGDRYSKTRQYKTHTKGAQEAHEAIRPTYMNKQEVSVNKDEQRLYELIWKRTIASQMAEVESERTNLEVSISNSKYLFVATGEVVTFDGFSRVYTQSTDDPQEEIRVLPAVALKEQLRLREAQAMQNYTKAPARFSEATLVKRMEELEIGRPSTYHPTVDTIQKVKYVEKVSIAGNKRDLTTFTLANGQITERTKSETYGADSQRLVPTDLGYITNDFLVEHFPEILNYDFTAQKEQQFDSIAEGKAEWVDTVDTFYKTLKPLLSSIPSGKVAGRVIGTDPESGLPVIAKISKNGPCVQIGDSNKEKPRFASLKKEQSIFTITLKEALELFQNALPYSLGEIEGKEVVVNEGKYGAYLRYNNAFYSLPKTLNPLEVTMEQATAIIQEKQQANTPIHQWGDVQVLNGRYGYYIHTPEGNFPIPKKVDISLLTEEDARALMVQAPKEKKSKRSFQKK